MDVDRLADLIRTAGSLGFVHIRTGTNGFVFQRPEGKNFEKRVQRLARTLADTPLRNFWISIDAAAAEVHENMRGFSGVIRGIEKALPVFHDHGLYPSANLGINRNVGGSSTAGLRPDTFPDQKGYAEEFYRRFRRAFHDFYRFVIDLGFTMVNTCYPMSIDGEEQADGLSAVYSATAVSDVVRFTASEKALLFAALLDTVPAFRSRVRAFSPLCSLYALCRQYGAGNGHAGYPCRGGIDFFFVDARDGNAYPCGYRGKDNFGKFCNLSMDGLNPLEADCRRCDWECFRDPSELFGPLLQGLHDPLGLVRQMRKDRSFYRYWLSDMAYYPACDFFNGRTPPRSRALERFRESRTFPPPCTASSQKVPPHNR
jgi:hypothetical protein